MAYRIGLAYVAEVEPKTLVVGYDERLESPGLANALSKGLNQVKRIIVKPDVSLSLQLHHHRAEHWVVVRGTARITRSDETLPIASTTCTKIRTRRSADSSSTMAT